MPRPELTPTQRAAGDKRGEILALHALAVDLMDKLDSFRHPDSIVEGVVSESTRHACDIIDTLDDALRVDAGAALDVEAMSVRLDRHLLQAPSPVRHAFWALRQAARRTPPEVSP